MASSEVEIASSSPFGSVLRDRNHREECRESNAKGTHNHHAKLQRNNKNFVTDINTCRGVSSDSATNENNSGCCSSKNKGVNQRKAPKNTRLERLRFTRASSFNNNNGIINNKKETSLSLLISPRHSQLLDRWATRQAREMVSNMENGAELLSMDDVDIFPRTPSSTSEEESSSSEIPNMAASSLVQIWEKRLNQCVVSKTNASFEKIGSSSSPTNEHANASLPEEECFDGPSGNEESSFHSFPEWESSDHSVSPQARSESGVSVASIIKKLTSTSQNQSPTPSFIDENEQEGYFSSSMTSVTGSPCRERECGQQQPPSELKFACPLRIRGRQAFNDLLMQMENDRHRELNNLSERGAVSKFAQKGRIQALLRIKLLQRDLVANDRSRQNSTSCELNRQSQGSAIMQLRERFSSGVEPRTPVHAEVATPRSPRRKAVNKTIQLGNSATTDQVRKDTRNQTAHSSANHATKSPKKSVSHTRIDHNTEEAPPSSDVMIQETNPRSDAKTQQKNSKETSEATTSMTDSGLNEMTDRAEASSEQNDITKSSNDETVNEEDISNQQYAESNAESGYQETLEVASNQNYAESSYGDEMEGEETDQNCDYESNYNWISEISRPRSYWEERRQAWYREMLETGSQNEDIRRLLERRTVSSFLSSDFRDRMDRLMESHRGTQAHLVNSQDYEENSQELMAFLQERLHSARASQEDGRDGIEEEEDEDNAEEHEHESLISDPYHEAGDYSNRSSSCSYRDNEGGDDFDRVVSPSGQPYQSQSFYPESRQSASPSTNHHSMEMELIYDLRGHMEQLYQEMSELKKIIKGCMNMQMELQQTMKVEVHSVKIQEKKSRNRTQKKKGNCCICYEVKVDSVLYRCGHMCACLKCAIELQCNSGKCPICRAKIVDVVRVYIDG